MKTSKPSTQQDVARHLGVSQNTVSAALRGSPRISAETQRKVAEAARQLGYRYNLSGVAMVTGRFSSLALVLGTDATRSALPIDLLHGVLDRATACNQHLQVAKLPDQRLQSDGFVPRILRELSADGLLINYSWRVPRELLNLIKLHNIPAIYLNTLRFHDAVRPDDQEAGGRAARWLVERGHRHLTYADFAKCAESVSGEHYSQAHRQKGFELAARKAGSTATAWRPLSDPPLQDYPGIARTFLIEQPQVTGVVCNGRDTAEALIAESRALGRRVPEDLSLVVIDAQPAWALAGGLPTLVVPNHAMGSAAVDLLLAKIDARERPQPNRLVPFAFYPGGLAPTEDPSPLPAPTADLRPTAS